MWENIVKFAQTQIQERLVSPLAGTFLVSWAIWNYKFLVILFSAASVTKTFSLIEEVAFPDAFALVTRGLLYPAVTAAAYIFVYPYPAKFVYEFTRKRQKEINEVRRRIEEETPLTIEESRRLRALFEKEEAALTQRIDSKNAEIERLRSQLAEAGARAHDTMLPAPVVDSADEIPVSQLNLLRSIESAGGRADERRLLSEGKVSKTRIEFDLEELVQKAYLVRTHSRRENVTYYDLSHVGRGYLLRNS